MGIEWTASLEKLQWSAAAELLNLVSVASFPLWHTTEVVMCFMSTSNDWFTRADGVISNYSRNTVEPRAEKETTVCDAPDRKEDEDLRSRGGAS